VAERGAEPVGRDDRHTLGAQAAALDVGAVDAQQGGGRDAEREWEVIRQARRSGLVMGSDTQMIAGSRVCSTSRPAPHPTITNRSSPHYAEALLRTVGGCLAWLLYLALPGPR
jgi:hypothetical protein